MNTEESQLHSQQHSIIHPKYRPDIDGLRAIAILFVLGFHAFPEIIKGGFIGVDIFFVISGFLISSIIFTNFERQTFSYTDFYMRRIRRIFPALTLVLITCFVLGWFILLPDEYTGLGKYESAGSTFISNLVTWNEAGYFDNASDTKPLLHLWSLGIEEQFYIFWPLLIGICWRYRFNFLAITLLVALSSFSINVATAVHHPIADFYSPLSRFWELMIGGGLAYSALHRPDRHLKTINLQSLAGITLIAAALLTINKDREFPGWWALLPTIGTFLLISAGPDAWLNRYVLGNRIMVGVGLISYPLYLWHLPLLTFARISYQDTPPVYTKLLLLVLSMLFASLTYLFVEKPIRFSLHARKSVPILLTTNVLILAVGLVIMASRGVPERFSEQVQAYTDFMMNYDYLKDARAGICWINYRGSPSAYAEDCVDPPQAAKRLVLIWGDSHAARFYPGLRAIDGGRDRLAQFTRDACAPIIDGVDRKDTGLCDKANDFVFDKIKKLKPNIVILFAYWPYHLPGGADDPNLQKLLSTIEMLKAVGIKNILVIGPNPAWKNKLPSDLVRQSLRSGGNSVPIRTFSLLRPEVQETEQVMKRAMGNLNGVVYFSAYDAMCDKDGCLTSVNGRADGLTSFDYGHLTTEGATYLARKMTEEIGYFKLSTADSAQ